MYDTMDQRTKDSTDRRIGYKELAKKKSGPSSPSRQGGRDLLERLRAENKRLRDDLKRFNTELNDKLKKAQKKKAGLGDLD